MLNVFGKVTTALLTVTGAGTPAESTSDPFFNSSLSFPVSHLVRADETFAKQLRKATSELHAEASDTVFTRTVMAGKLCTDQYNLFLKQRVAILEVVDRILFDNPKLPRELQQFYTKDEHKMIEGLRKDLGLKKHEEIKPRDLLPETRIILALLDKMNHYEIAVIAYTMSGETAYGAQQLVGKLKEQNITNTAGLSAYKVAEFHQLAKRMNLAVTDPNLQLQMTEAAKKFYRVVIFANNAQQWDPKK